MPYLAPTPADIKADFPPFAAVADNVIQRRIDRTASRVDESWGEADYTWARELLTAHYLVEDGFGAGTDAEMAGLGLSGVSRLKSASLDVTFREDSSANDGSEFGGTSYGRRFQALMNRLFAGPRTTGGVGGCIAGAATDVPWAWRTNGWGL